MTNRVFPVKDRSLVPNWNELVNDALTNLAQEWITTPESSYGWADCDLYAAALENARANDREEPSLVDKIFALVFALSGELKTMDKCKPWGGE